MAPQCVGTSEAAATAPRATGTKFAAADEFLFARVEAFMSFSIVLACKGLATDGADEGSFVGMGAEMRAEVVGTREAFRAEITLEGGRMFLNLPIAGNRGSSGIGKLENVVPIGDRWGGGSAGSRGG